MSDAIIVDCGGCVERGVVACETCDDCGGARRVPAVDEIARLHREHAWYEREFRKACEAQADNFESQLMAFVAEAKRIANDWRPMPSPYEVREHAKVHPSPIGDGWSAWFCRTRRGFASIVQLLVLEDDGDEPTIVSAGGVSDGCEFRPATRNGDGAAWPATATQEPT